MNTDNYTLSQPFKPHLLASFPSTSAGDYRELPMVTLRGEGCCGVGRASRDSAGFGAMEEGLISRGGLMKVKEESGKVGLKLNIQKTNIMASGPITSWQIDGQTVETVADFIFGDLKIIADADCCHEITKHLLNGRKVMTNLDSILKSRNITSQTRSV